jgi:hypothetical protein
MRNGEEVKLSLVKKSLPYPPFKNDLIDLYQSKKYNIKLITNDTYQNISSKQLWSTQTFISLNDLQLNFRFQLLGLEYINEQHLPRIENINSIYLKIYLYNGIQIIDTIKETEQYNINNEIRIQQMYHYRDLPLSMLPRTTRLGFILMGKNISGEEEYLGYTILQLVNETCEFVMGKQILRMWSFPKIKKGHGKVRDIVSRKQSFRIIYSLYYNIIS